MLGHVGLRVGDSPSQCTKGQPVPWIGCVRIADLVHLCFENTSRRIMKNIFEQRWANIFCTKLDKKVAETWSGRWPPLCWILIVEWVLGSVNVAYYSDVLERQRRKVIRVRKGIVATQVLHHGNAPDHTSPRVREFLAKHNAVTLPRPPYSPPADFFLFPRIKTTLKGRHFDNIEAIQVAVITAF